MNKLWFFTVTLFLASCSEMHDVQESTKNLRVKSKTEVPFILYSGQPGGSEYSDLYLLADDKYIKHYKNGATRDPVGKRKISRGDYVMKGKLNVGQFKDTISELAEFVERSPNTIQNSNFKLNQSSHGSRRDSTITFNTLELFESFGSSIITSQDYLFLFRQGEIAYAPAESRFNEKRDLLDYMIFEDSLNTKLYLFEDDSFFKYSSNRLEAKIESVIAGALEKNEFLRIKYVLQNYFDKKENFTITNGVDCWWFKSKNISFFNRGEFTKLSGRKNCNDPNYDEISELFDLSVFEEPKIN